MSKQTGSHGDGTSAATRLIRPAYLTAADYPWLERLIEETRRFVGHRRADLDRRLVEPMPFEAPRFKLALAGRLIKRFLKEAPVSDPSPCELRAKLFNASARMRANASNHPPLGSAAFREAVVRSCSVSLAKHDDYVKQLLTQHLYADIPTERIIASIPTHVTGPMLAIAVNGALVASHLKRAHEVSIELIGESRRVIRQAKLRGLLCTVVRTDFGVRLSISGPLSVIRRTTYYGRALAELVPFLAWCPSFKLIASCTGMNGTYGVLVQSGDPLPPAPAAPAYDSKVERLRAGF